MAKTIDTRSPAERDADNQRQEKEKKEQRLNRQINFLVMREMWQVVRGRAHQHNDTIYAQFGMSRSRYTRAINGGSVRIGKEELTRLTRLTGVSHKIFLGEACFNFEYITRKDWEKLFQLREYDIDQFETHSKYLFSQIKNSDDDLLKNEDYHRYMRYLKSQKSALDFLLIEAIEEYTKWMKQIKISHLEHCPSAVLKNYYKELKLQSDIVGTLLHYAELRQADQ